MEAIEDLSGPLHRAALLVKLEEKPAMATSKSAAESSRWAREPK
jgi:hypothetical protein